MVRSVCHGDAAHQKTQNNERSNSGRRLYCKVRNVYTGRSGSRGVSVYAAYHRYSTVQYMLLHVVYTLYILYA
jgi:hypothetical protein